MTDVSTLTLEEIESRIRESDMGLGNWLWEIGGHFNSNETPFPEGSGLEGSVKCVLESPMYDGQRMYKVFELPDGRLIQAEGFYSSWGDSEWEQIYEVEPLEVTITEYRVKE